MASKQHGLTTMNSTRPKSKLSKKRNKAKARERKAGLLKSLNEAVMSARGAKARKAAPVGAPKATPKSKS